MARDLAKICFPDPRIRIFFLFFSQVVVALYPPTLLVGMAGVCMLVLLVLLRRPGGYGPGTRLFFSVLAYSWISNFAVLLCGGTDLTESAVTGLYRCAQFVVLAFPLALWRHSSFLEFNSTLHWLLRPLPVRNRTFVASLVSETVFMFCFVPEIYRFRRALLIDRGVSLLRRPLLCIRTMAPDLLAEMVRNARERARLLVLPEQKAGGVSGAIEIPRRGRFIVELLGTALLMAGLIQLPVLLNL